MYGLGASLMVDGQETIGYVVCTRRFRDHVESGRWRQNIAMAILAIMLARCQDIHNTRFMQTVAEMIMNSLREWTPFPAEIPFYIDLGMPSSGHATYSPFCKIWALKHSFLK